MAGYGSYSFAMNKAMVWVRTKPTDKFAHEIINLHPNGQTVGIHLKRDPAKGMINNEMLDWEFKLDGILHNASQELIFSTVASDMVKATLEGYNGTIMTYGQTGAGKTFTMTGALENYDNRGIIPRALSQLFLHIKENPDSYFSVRISYLEIFNEAMYDLLSTSPGSSSPSSLYIVEDADGGVSVRGLQNHLAPTEEEALNLLFVGESNRAVGPHCLNKVSSRSHCIFTLYVVSHSKYESDPKYAVSKLHFVDLAGSERLKKTQSEGRTKDEAMHINKSLSFLEQTVVALSRNSVRVPYRQSHLTHCLKDSLGGNCLTRLIANVWVEASQVEETISTLRFASRVMSVAVKPTANIHLNAVLVIKQLEHELFWLKKELAMHDALTNRPQVSYDPLTDQQRMEILKQAKQFLDGQVNEIEIVNLRQLQTVLETFREISSQMYKDIEAKLRARYTLVDKTDPAAIAAAQQAGLPIGDDGELIGDVSLSGFSIGPASPGTKSSQSSARRREKAQRKLKAKDSAVKQQIVLSHGRGKSDAADQLSSTSVDLKREDILAAGGSSAKLKDPTSSRPSTPPLKEEAFEDFKKEQGHVVYGILKDNKATFVTKKSLYNALSKKINKTKCDLDQSLVRLKKLREARFLEGWLFDEDGNIIIDESEYLEIQKVLNLKAVYRAAMEELNSLKPEVQYCERQVDLSRHRMVQEFDAWYAENFLPPEPSAEASAASSPDQKTDALPKLTSAPMLEDEHEKFERLQMAVLMANPDSAPFYKAQLRNRRREIFEAAVAQFPSSKSPSHLPGRRRNSKPIYL